MRSVRPCVALLLGLGAQASSHVRPKHGLVHRVAKAQITPPPALRPRDGAVSVCPADHSLCPESLSGGCCPSRYACAADSCYATTAAIASACGQEGWFACPAADSGGCCPVGYVCGPTDCSAPVGVKNTITSCPASYYLCPAEMNFGCCQTGMGCAPNACYSTAPVPTTVVQRITTTDGDGETITSTRTTVTTVTPTAPPRLVAQDPNVAAKFIPSTIPKTPATSAPSSTPSGLTKSQIGGIIGGAVALLLVVLVAAFFILKRLNLIHHTLSAPSEMSSHTHPQPQQQYSHLSQTHDDTSFDPLVHLTPGTNTNTPPAGLRSRSTSNQFSPTFDPHPRQVSVDSAAGPPGYFDLPPRVHNVPGVRGRSSVDSYAGHPYHQRHQSNASDVSDGPGGGVTSPLVVQELDSAGYVELPSGGGFEEVGGGYRSRANSGSVVVVSPRGSFQATGRQRSGSGGTTVAGGGRDVSPGFVGSPPLDVVNEHSEIMTGYYGPRDRQVGQTAAGLEVGVDVSSPGGEGWLREVGGVLHPPREYGGEGEDGGGR